jgi:hypothetical protein
VFLISFSGFTVQAVPVLQISVLTDSQVYNVGGRVNVLTNITLDQNATANLAALEIDLPNAGPLVIRTIKTGNVSQMYFRVQFVDMYMSTSGGVPKTLFNPGEIAYVTMYVKNIDVVIHQVLIGLFIQGSDNRSLLAYYPSLDNIDSNTTIQHIFSFALPTNAPPGQARIFTSLFTNVPASSGYAYCPEQAANFSIGTSTPILPQQPEYSNMTFNLPRKDCQLGNYTIHATTNYNVIQTATDTAQFTVVLLGDMNHDNTINMRDINALILVFNTTPQSPNWNPEADLNKDNVVNMRDISILVLTFGNTAAP